MAVLRMTHQKKKKRMTHQCDSSQPGASQKVFRKTVSWIFNNVIIPALYFIVSNYNKDILIEIHFGEIYTQVSYA